MVGGVNFRQIWAWMSERKRFFGELGAPPFTLGRGEVRDIPQLHASLSEAALMRTECKQATFEFHGLFQRKVKARFDGGKITSDAGVLLLREVEQRTVSEKCAARLLIPCPPGSVKYTEDHPQNSREPRPVSLLQRSRIRPAARQPPRKRTVKLRLFPDFSLILLERIAVPLPLNRCQRLIA